MLDAWLAEHGEDANALTRTIEAQLRAVTLNFATAERAARAVRLARILSALAGEPGSVAQPRSLDVEADLARRIDRATDVAGGRLRHRSLTLQTDLVTRLDTLEHELSGLGIGLEDVRISTRWTAGTRFLVKEGPILVLAMSRLPSGG